MNHFLENELLTSLGRAFSQSVKPMILIAVISICTVQHNAYAATPEQLAEIRNHINRGNMLLGRRLFQDAIGEYENVLRIDPVNQIAKDNIALTHNNWGINFFSARKYPEAKQQWEQALKLNPSDGHARRNLKILEQRMRQEPPVSAQDCPEGDGSDKAKLKVNPAGGNANATAHTGATENSTAPPVVPAQGQQQARLDNTSVIQNPDSGATLIINSSTNYNQPTPDSESQTSPPPENTTIRIIGGSNSSASIVGTGASLSAGTPPAQSFQPSSTSTFNIVAPNTGSVSSIYQSGTAGSGSGSGNTNSSTTPAGSSYASSNAMTPSYSSGSPVDRGPPGQSVPMSWPGASDSTPSAQTVTQASSTPSTPTSFTRNQPSIKQNDSAEGEQSEHEQEKGADGGANFNATFENKVSQIETTVYGKSTKSVPILRRIEKLEIDTFGKKKTGSISDRIKDLKEAYGI
ncbi:MAG: tetratricopeptide repeat protein [Candidatus Obscuribacterales bacterium]|nr:tetratricopeptide repeat protein [Candidatus Obscuribacterales bacterium]